MFGNKKRERKEKRRITMLSFVWFTKEKKKEKKDLFFFTSIPTQICE